MRLTTADLVVLAVVLFDRPMHGYELVGALEASHGEDWAAVSKPQVYYSLRKLAKHGYLKPILDDENSLGPERIVYKPTAKARHESQRALRESKWIERHSPSPFTTWSVLALNAPSDTVREVISSRKEMLESEIAKEKTALRSLGKATDQANVKVARVLIKIAIGQFKAELTYLDELEKAILSGRPSTAEPE